MNSVLLYTSKIILFLFYFPVLFFYKLKFKNRLDVTSFFCGNEKPTHFIYRVKQKEKPEWFVIKIKNPVTRIYHKKMGLDWLPDKECFLILKKLTEDVVLKNNIPKVVLFENKILTEVITESESLKDFLAKNPTLAERMKIKKQVQDFTSRLHDLGYVHGDIKAKNILLNEKGEIYFIDWDYLNFQTPASIVREEKTLQVVLDLFNNKE